MPEIKFSHNYPKLHNQTKANLLCILKKQRGELDSDFVEYDSAFQGGHFPLPDGNYIILVFIGNKLIPFTTVRPYSEQKWNYYKFNIRKWFTLNFWSKQS